MRMIFINLPVSDLNATKRFFGALGFSFNPEFSDDSCAAMIVEENIYAMLQLQARFKEFITQPVSDAFQTTETITCLSASSRAEVDDTLAKALAAGARPWKPVIDLGFMYGCSFQDPDGHVWEFVYMDPNAERPSA
jgi:uncharacterized protein